MEYITGVNKHKIYKAIFKSIVIFGTEVWLVKDRAEKSLKSTEMNYWRRAAGKTRLQMKKLVQHCRFLINNTENT